MTVSGTKLSAIPTDPTPVLTDTVVGVRPGGPTDLRWTLANIQTAVGGGALTLIPPGTFQQFFVATTGSDTTGDGSVGNPWRTIQFAVNWCCQHLSVAAHSIVRITVAAGTYNESVYLGGYSGAGLQGGGMQVFGAGRTSTFITAVGVDAAVTCTEGTWGLGDVGISAPGAQGGNHQGAGGVMSQGQNAFLGIVRVAYGNCNLAAHNACLFGGYINVDDVCDVTGAGSNFVVAVHPGSRFYFHHGFVNYMLDPGYTATLFANRQAFIFWQGDSADIGTALGNPAYLVTQGSRISVSTLGFVAGVTTLTLTQVDAGSILDNGTLLAPSFPPDTGAGGQIGYVPAPGAGDAAAGKFLKADATWGVPPGTGGTPANPTATGSDTAVNGIATTFMRSDAAFAIQKTSAAQFGLCKVDNTTITAAAGVISSTGGAVGANPTATGSDTAVNGVATTFLRSDGAPAIQKTSSTLFGLCKVDNATITAAGGVITAIGGAATLVPDTGFTANTFDPAFLSGSGLSVVLSNGNLTASDVVNETNSIRTLVSKATGKFYCEMQVNLPVGSGFSRPFVTLGICNGTQTVTQDLAGTTNGFCYFNFGSVYFNSGVLASLPIFVLGDVVSMAIDIAGQLVWYRTNGGIWNNNVLADPATGAHGVSFAGLNAGPYYVAVELTGSGSLAGKCTINVGGSAFAYAIPSGFTTWENAASVPGSTITGGIPNYLLQVDPTGTNLTQTAGNIHVGATGIDNGTAGHVVYDDGHFFNEAPNFTITTSTGNANIVAGAQLEYGGQQIIQAQLSQKNYYEGGAGNLTGSGSDNYATGFDALAAITSGNLNVAIGVQAAQRVTSGVGNAALGGNALNNCTIGGGNFALGFNSMFGELTGSNNVAIGSTTLFTSTADSDNVAVGNLVLNSLNGGSGNVGLGSNSLQSLTSGSNNLAVGAAALSSALTVSSNIGIGHGAAQSTSGSNNIFIGFNSGGGVGSGSHNTVIADNENTLTNGGNNVIIGAGAGIASGTASNQLVIQNIIYGTGNSGTGVTVSTGKIGIGIVAPARTLDVNGGIGQNEVTALIHATTAMNNGAAANLGTLTNAPAVGNPTKWIPIDDAGVTRYIPCW